MDVLLLPLVIAAAILGCAWHFSRGRVLLARWAESEGLTIVSADYCWLRRGPFWWRSNDGNAVYRVVVRDTRHGTRRGYVRCGGLFAGMWTGATTVEWDS